MRPGNRVEAAGGDRMLVDGIRIEHPPAGRAFGSRQLTATCHAFLDQLGNLAALIDRRPARSACLSESADVAARSGAIVRWRGLK